MLPPKLDGTSKIYLQKLKINNTNNNKSKK